MREILYVTHLRFNVTSKVIKDQKCFLSRIVVDLNICYNFPLFADLSVSLKFIDCILLRLF